MIPPGKGSSTGALFWLLRALAPPCTHPPPRAQMSCARAAARGAPMLVGLGRGGSRGQGRPTGPWLLHRAGGGHSAPWRRHLVRAGGPPPPPLALPPLALRRPPPAAVSRPGLLRPAPGPRAIPPPPPAAGFGSARRKPPPANHHQRPFCPRSGIHLCVICPWQQILQLAHGLGTSMHARGCSDSTPRGSPRSGRTPAATTQRAARCSETAPQ
jgi:hypothetical protein